MEKSDGKLLEAELQQLLQGAKGEKIDIAASVYDIIKKAERPAEQLRFFLESADEIESSGENEVEKRFTASEVQKLKNDCEQLISGALSKMINSSLEEDAFYQGLWENVIDNNPMLSTENEKIYALYQIWRDGRIPYFKLEQGLKMSNERFKEISMENRGLLKKAIFVMNREFEQKTERSSNIVRILDMCKNEEEKAVILAQVLDIGERKVLSSLLEGIQVRAKAEE